MKWSEKLRARFGKKDEPEAELPEPNRAQRRKAERVYRRARGKAVHKVKLAHARKVRKYEAVERRVKRLSQERMDFLHQRALDRIKAAQAEADLRDPAMD